MMQFVVPEILDSLD